MMRTMFAVVIVVFTAMQLSLAAVERGEILSYSRSSGGMSSHRSVTVTIMADGSGLVHFDLYEGRDWDYRFNLSKAELADIHSRIKRSAVFDKSIDDNLAPKGSREHLVVTSGGARREAWFYREGAVDPLLQALDGLINQALVLKEFEKPEKDCNVYMAETAVHPRLVGWKVHQPQTLRKPLEDFILKVESPSKMSFAITALSWVAPPSEFAAFIARAIAEASGERRYEMIRQMSIHPFTSEIPETHVQPLQSVLLEAIVDDYPIRNRLPDNEKRAIETAARFIGQKIVEEAAVGR